MNKYLSSIGYCSRRKADELIQSGLIKVKGQIIDDLGFKVSPNEKDIEIQGEPIESFSTKRHYLAFYKPPGVITSMSDPHGRLCVGDDIKKLNVKVLPVGRLDYDAQGLLLLTNDGDLAYKLTHPKFNKSKIYWVKIKGHPNKDAVSKLLNGVYLEEGKVKAQSIRFEKKLKANTWLTMTLAEGRNRQIKRMWFSVGHDVLRIVRTEFAGIELSNLKPGQFRKLSTYEIAKIRQ